MILGVSCLSVASDLVRRTPRPEPAARIDPREVHADGYVGSHACRACHPDHHASWHASYHRSMTQVASPRTILAPFDGTELNLEGVTWQLERRADEFWVTGTEPVANSSDVIRLEKRIVMTTGSHNYQLYWMESDGESGMIPFPLVYLLRDHVWIPRKSRFLTPPVERTPPEAGRWSVHCIKCHATRGQPQPPPDGETSVAELGISCEACHGPGLTHVAHNRSPLHRFRSYLTDAPDPDIVNPSRLPHDRATQVCAQCHAIEIFLTGEDASRWREGGSRFRPGDDLTEYQTIVAGRYDDNPPEVQEYLDRHPVFRLRNCFWSDGMLRVTGREYHAMEDTPCYQRGEMSCLSCHRLHRAADDPRPLEVWTDDQLGAKRGGDEACVQCHETYRDSEVLSAHSHHDVGSDGSRCFNCHMPYTTWGLLRAIRSHTIDSPSVAKSVETGRPNACNQCHLDRTLAWTAANLEEWYGISSPDLSEDERTVAASVLWTLSGDAVQRALMAWNLGWEPARRVSGAQWMVPYLCALLADPYDVVRYRAQRSLRLYPEYRAVVADSAAGATPEQQDEMMGTVLTRWYASFPTSGGQSGPHLLIRPDARIERQPFARLASLRRNDPLVLFE